MTSLPPAPFLLIRARKLTRVVMYVIRYGAYGTIRPGVVPLLNTYFCVCGWVVCDPSAARCLTSRAGFVLVSHQAAWRLTWPGCGADVDVAVEA
jgi:hypothetical protein